MTDKARILYGIQDCYIARIQDERQLTYDTPKPLPGAISLKESLDPQKNKIYGDNQVWFTLVEVDSIEGSLDLNYISDDMAEYIFGYETSKEGYQVQSTSPNADKFALLYKSHTDKGAKCFCLYSVVFAPPSLELTTKTDKTDTTTFSLEFTAAPVVVEGFDKPIAKINTKVGADPEVIKNWFKQVPKPTKQGA